MSAWWIGAAVRVSDGGRENCNAYVNAYEHGCGRVNAYASERVNANGPQHWMALVTAYPFVAAVCGSDLPTLVGWIARRIVPMT